MPIFPDNFVANSLSGTILVSDGHANLSLTTNPYALEGDKSFIIKLRKGGTNGLVIATSSPITLRDTSSIVSFTANISSVNEGNLVQFTLVTANAVDNSNVYYSVFPATANITRQDFFGANTGMATIVSNQATFALRANADLSLVDETGENFRVQLRTNSPVGNIIYSTSNVEILDVSKGFNILSFVENNSTVAEGGTLTLTFNATNVPVGTVFHYFTEGNATTSTFTGGNTGSFVMNGLSNTVTLLPTAVPYSTTQNFNVKLRALSNTGAVVATSNNIIAIDSAIAFIDATGGTIINDTANTYRLHTFTSSGNLTISSLGSTGTIEYLAVGGGGGGGWYGGGGGAGGVLYSASLLVPSTGNIIIQIGGGGAGGIDAPATLAINGGNTIISGLGITTATAFGGGRGSMGTAALSNSSIGGSGGGGWAGPGGDDIGSPGITGQGYPGGAGDPVTGNWAGGGGGAGQAGHPGTSSPLHGRGGNGTSTYSVILNTANVGYYMGSGIRWIAGGGGGGGWGPDTTYPAGGLGGGGSGRTAGSGPTGTAGFGTVNMGGGGGGAGYGTPSRGGAGGSGVVIIRYPYVAPTTISNVLVTPSGYIVGSNITFTINAINANLTTLYYTTDGNVDSSYFIGGNTGSFVANASGGIVTLLGNTNATVPVGETRNFRLQIRQDSITGFISSSSSNVALLNSADFYINATGGSDVFVSGGYKIHTFNTSSTLNITSIGGTGAIEYLIVSGGGGVDKNTPASAPYTGGGGGGGVISGTAILPGSPVTITVGAGGTGGTPSPATASSATASSISGTGLSLTANAGGKGSKGSAGASGNGFSGGSFNAPPRTAGGGGAGGAGGNATPTAAGVGGVGAIGTIAPASYGTPGPNPGRYFGGGGGGTGGDIQNIPSAGGAGGGGAGGQFPGAGFGSPGTINTGGGGGAGYFNYDGGSGGSGIVIIRYPYN